MKTFTLKADDDAPSGHCWHYSVKGEVIKEDSKGYLVKEPDGEERYLPKERIIRIE